MKTVLVPLCAFTILISSATVAHAAAKCVVEKSAYDRATTDYNRADQQYTRLQAQVDAKYEQGENRRAILEGNVEVARGNLNAAQGGGLGQGFGCFLFRPNCLGSTIARTTQQVARARGNLRAQEGRLNAFVRAYQQQMTRLSARVTEQEAIVSEKKAELDIKEAAYQACMAQ